jgi:hypothetical protein
MTPLQALQQHHQLCDELHALALEENRFLQQNQRAPDAPLLEKKRALLAQLDETLAALRTAQGDSGNQAALRQALEKTRARILQVLQLEKENEQLLLRFSLGAARPAAPAPTMMPASMLQKIYQRHV